MTAIEWTQKVWNPTTGCDRVSPGCDHCYALTMAKRLKGMGSAKYQNDGDPRTSGPGFGITEHPDALTIPLRWRQGQRVFVNSMSDLFHDGVTDEFISRVFAVMAATPQHTYQVLTKRHGRMRSLLNREDFRFEVMTQVAGKVAAGDLDIRSGTWPLPNVWLGVSVEDQKRADLRIPALLNTPAAVRFLSCEPLLGPVDLSPWSLMIRGDARDRRPALDWVIVGGESGSGARPMHPAWARQLRDQCTAAGVPFFFKQHGEYTSVSRDGDPWLWREPAFWMSPDGRQATEQAALADGGSWIAMHRGGKKLTGRELDGRTWDEYPQVMAS